MATYRLIRSQITHALESVPASAGIAAAGAANAAIGIEAFRSVAFEDLPADVVRQLRRDGTRGELRDLDGARAVYEQNVPAEARGSVEGVEAITNDPNIHWMHHEPHAAGGGTEAANGTYGPASLNQSIGARPMQASEIAEAEAYTRLVAEEATPGVSGDLPEVVGDALHTAALGGVLGGGVAAAHRWAQVQGFRHSGRHDLAAAAGEQLAADATKGAINGVVRGTTVAVTQAVLGANPLTAGIGLVVPDAVQLLTQKDQLSERDYHQKALGVVGKGALATALVCAGPVGWMGLAGLSIASAYGQAMTQGTASRLRAS